MRNAQECLRYRVVACRLSARAASYSNAGMGRDGLMELHEPRYLKAVEGRHTAANAMLLTVRLQHEFRRVETDASDRQAISTISVRDGMCPRPVCRMPPCPDLEAGES